MAHLTSSAKFAENPGEFLGNLRKLKNREKSGKIEKNREKSRKIGKNSEKSRNENREKARKHAPGCTWLPGFQLRQISPKSWAIVQGSTKDMGGRRRLFEGCARTLSAGPSCYTFELKTTERPKDSHTSSELSLALIWSLW